MGIYGDAAFFGCVFYQNARCCTKPVSDKFYQWNSCKLWTCHAVLPAPQTTSLLDAVSIRRDFSYSSLYRYVSCGGVWSSICKAVRKTEGQEEHVSPMFL